eukprot:EG_transcript_11267
MGPLRWAVTLVVLLCCGGGGHGRLYPPRDKVLGVPATQKYYVAICARVESGDGPYLDEWVAYHLAAGADHIFLGVDPAADGHTQLAVRRWRANRFVTRMRWNKTLMDSRVSEPNLSNSFQARCYDVVGSRTRWMALIDTDEFIVPRGCSIPHAIAQSCHPLIPWIPLIWTMFGSGHRDDRRFGANLVIEDFVLSGGNCTHSCPHAPGQFHPYCGECRHTKAVVNTFCARTARHAHHHWVEHVEEMPPECLQAIRATPEELACRPSNQMLEGRGDVGPVVKECSAALQLHHYGTLSRAEFFTRRALRRRDGENNLRVLWGQRDLNHVARPEAQKFATAVRHILGLKATAPHVTVPQCPAPPTVLAAAQAGNWRSLDLEAAATGGLPPVESLSGAAPAP